MNTYETNGPGSNLRLTNFVQIYLHFLKVENYQAIARYYNEIWYYIAVSLAGLRKIKLRAAPVARQRDGS